MVRLGYRGYESGKVVVDTTFSQNIEGALEAGIKVGVYFFSQAITKEEAIEEAEFVLQQIKDYPIGMPIVYDTEKIKNSKYGRNNLTILKRQDFVLTFGEMIKDEINTPRITAKPRW